MAPKVNGNYRGKPRNPAVAEKDRPKEDRVPPPSSLATEMPPFPQTLDKVGQSRWTEIGLILYKKNLLSPDFYPALEHLCRAYDMLEDIDSALAVSGLMIKGASLQAKPNSLLKERMAILFFIRGMLCDFGLTPQSARAANIPVNNRPGDALKEDDGTQVIPDEDPFDE